MATTSPVSILAVADPVVEAATVTAIARIERVLSEAGCDRPVFAVTTGETAGAETAGGPRPHLITTLADEVETLDDDWSAVESRLRARIDGLRPRADRIFLCTVLRAAPPEVSDDRRRRLIARIRRLDLLAVRISAETGVFVVDIDRALAAVGASALATDHRLGGPHAGDAVARAIAATLMAAGLDRAIPFAFRELVGDMIADWVPPTRSDPVGLRRPFRTIWAPPPPKPPKGLWPHFVDVVRRRRSPRSFVSALAGAALRRVARRRVPAGD